MIFAPVYFGLMMASLFNWALVFFFPRPGTYRSMLNVAKDIGQVYIYIY